jgi:membrane protease YdiL (CAAX protease family)
VRNVVYLGLVVVAIGVAARFGFDLTRAGQPGFVLWMMIPTVVIAGLGCFRAYQDGVLRGWLSVRSGDFTRGFFAAAVLFAAAWAFTKVVTPQGSPRESWLVRLYLQIGDPAVLRKNVTLVVGAIIVMVIAEELVWRGLVIGLLEEIVGSRRAWIWSAVAYAVAHAPAAWALRDPHAGPNPLVPLGALACGLVWGGMARRYERLLPGVFSHVLFDWTVVMMFRLWGPSV